MKRGFLATVVITSALSAAMSSLVTLAIAPAAVDAQIARLTAPGLTLVGDDGLPGVTADVRPTGGGVLRIFGIDGTVARVTVGAAGVAPGQPPNPANAGVDIFSVDSVRIGRIGTLPDVAGSPIGVALWDMQGNVRYRVTLDADGDPSIHLFDPTGRAIWSAP